jgi:hypothetical protein
MRHLDKIAQRRIGLSRRLFQTVAPCYREREYLISPKTLPSDQSES